jgi:hypothetical protein
LGQDACSGKSRGCAVWLTPGETVFMQASLTIYFALTVPISSNTQVSMKMRDRLPGHELLMLPEQTQLILHQKVEVAELLGDVVGESMGGWFEGLNGLNTPNIYAVRSRDGVTYFVLKQQVEKKSMSSICCETLAAKCCAAKRCIKQDFKFNVIDARTGEKVAVIDSPPALDDDCCVL